MGLTTRVLRKVFLPPHYTSLWIRNSSSSLFISTPIYYVNAAPHIGHLYTSLLADAYFRYSSLKGVVGIFSTGTDEHGMKIEKVAKQGTLQHCDSVSRKFRELADQFGISYTDFVRTTENRHKRVVSHLWMTLWDNGCIYKSQYQGWYSMQDEAFVPETGITETKTDNGEIIKVSQESGHQVEWTMEENYVFKLKQFIPEVRNWIKTCNPVKPSKFQDILLNWIDEGFENLSVSRPKSRLSWGIPVPNDDSQVIYVWLDALSNYLTCSGYPDKFKLWPPVHVVGKDILKFHAIYWPAFLIAVGLEPPRKIVCHSHWTVDGKKMSKSLGNVVDPFSLGNVYGNDGLRYFLLREGTPHSDSNYTEEKMRRLLNAELADTFGNLLSRCSGKIVNPSQIWPEWNDRHFNFISQTGLNLKQLLEALPTKVEQSYEEFNFYRGLEHIMATARAANLYVEETQPWVLAKKSPNDPILRTMLSLVFETLRVISILTIPIVPNLSKNVLDRLNIPSHERKWNCLKSNIWEEQLDKSGDKHLGPQLSLFFKRIRV